MFMKDMKVFVQVLMAWQFIVVLAVCSACVRLPYVMHCYAMLCNAMRQCVGFELLSEQPLSELRAEKGRAEPSSLRNTKGCSPKDSKGRV